MTFAPSVVSLGGVTVGLSILAWYVTHWWLRGKKHWRTLVPFIPCALYGMLLVLAAGGLLGGFADVTLWGSSAIGDAALKYGLGSGSPRVTRNSSLVLTDGGHAFVLILTVVLLAVWKKRGGFDKDMVLGVVCGICLGLSSGVAGWTGRILGPVVSWCGDAIVGLL